MTVLEAETKIVTTLLHPPLSSVPRKNDGKSRLPANFLPSSNTVICGRGKACSTASGNRRLRKIVNSYLQPYSQARNKLEKSSIVSTIITKIKEDNAAGAFVKFEDSVWWEVDDAVAREKIGCLLRDCLHTQYRSSTKAKLARRKALKTVEDTTDDYLPAPVMSTSNESQSTATESTSSMAEDIFGPNSTGSYYPIAETQVRQNTRLPYKSMQDYCSLLSHYIDDQGSRPRRADFLRDCLPVSASADFIGSSSLARNQQNARFSTRSALEQACSLVMEDNDNDSLEHHDLPDDISGIFED
jgi:hypothetical protein